MSSNWAPRYGSLGIIVLQTTMTVLLLRYSRTSVDDSQPYIASTAVLSSEVCKFVLCIGSLLVYSGYSVERSWWSFRDEILMKPCETSKLIVPSGLYAVQNNLLYLALSNLDAATYQVTYQLKILTTALFSVVMLKKHITGMQWLALVVLTTGVALVQLPGGGGSDEAVPVDRHVNRTVGLAAVLTACVSSGLAGVYFEMLVKTGKQTSIVIRNLQLGIFSLVFASLAVIWNDYDSVTQGGFFQGYTPVVVVLVLLQAFGGLVVAVAVKYADNILKVFATSISIILSTVCSYWLLNDLGSTGPFFCLGAPLVILATVIYGKFPSSSGNSQQSEKK